VLVKGDATLAKPPKVWHQREVVLLVRRLEIVSENEKNVGRCSRATQWARGEREQRDRNGAHGSEERERRRGKVEGRRRRREREGSPWGEASQGPHAPDLSF